MLPKSQKQFYRTLPEFCYQYKEKYICRYMHILEAGFFYFVYNITSYNNQKSDPEILVASVIDSSASKFNLETKHGHKRAYINFML